MPPPRKDIVTPGEEGIYHCVSRCVRRAFLCGNDPYTGQSFEHRKTWVLARMRRLSNSFAIDVVTCAIMSNHHHLCVRTRPDLVNILTDRQVAERWLRALPRRFDEDWESLEIDEFEVDRLVKDRDYMDVLRARLADLSWFMRFLNEYIARRANAEDNVTGHFFESRFKCTGLLGPEAVLAGAAYVDLNLIRALLAESPETSQFTGAHERIQARQGVAKIMGLAEARRLGPDLAPARGRLNEAQTEEIRSAFRARTRDRWLCPLDSRDNSGQQQVGSRRGVFPLSVDQYLELLDWTACPELVEGGRQIRSDKRGAIPDHLAPILKRLSLEVSAWLKMVESMGSLFWRVVGRVEAMAFRANAAGKRWFKGLSESRSIFGTT